MTVELWRCTSCGKWSHAKRRPSAHQRMIVLEEGSACPEHERADCCPLGGCGAATPTITETRWCGPFERYVAALDDPAPPAPSARIGEFVEDPHEGPDPLAATFAQGEAF
jgi:hypothetical protein